MNRNRLCRAALPAAVFLLLSGCAAGVRPMVGPPWMQDYMMNGPPGSTPLFQQGWRHGCETGISATANNFQKMFYRFTQDYELAQKREYYAGWQGGLKYCHRYVFQYLRRNII